MRKKLAAAAFAALVTIPFAPAADAADVRTCTASGTVTFDPPLNLTNVIDGTMVWDYVNICVTVTSSGASYVENYPGTQEYWVNGSCITANIVGKTSGTQGILVGATHMTRYDTSPYAVRDWVLYLHSPSVCGVETARVAQGGTGGSL